jgi:hypothetical protein
MDNHSQLVKCGLSTFPTPDKPGRDRSSHGARRGGQRVGRYRRERRRESWAATWPKTSPTWLPASCATCGHRWYGIDRAHCAGCHRTFADPHLSDHHRLEHRCANAVALGMVKHPGTGIREPRAQPNGRDHPR